MILLSGHVFTLWFTIGSVSLQPRVALSFLVTATSVRVPSVHVWASASDIPGGFSDEIIVCDPCPCPFFIPQFTITGPCVNQVLHCRPRPRFLPIYRFLLQYSDQQCSGSFGAQTRAYRVDTGNFYPERGVILFYSFARLAAADYRHCVVELRVCWGPHVGPHRGSPYSATKSLKCKCRYSLLSRPRLWTGRSSNGDLKIKKIDFYVLFTLPYLRRPKNTFKR